MTTRPPEAPPVHANPPVSQSSAAEDRRFERRPGNGDGFGRPASGEREVSASNLFAPSAPPPRHDPQPPYRPAPQAAANGDQRGRLHLSLGNGSHGNGGSQPEPRFTERPQAPALQTSPQPTLQYASANGGSERPVSSAPSPHRYPGPAEPNHHAGPSVAAPVHTNGGHPGLGRGDAQPEQRPEQRREGGGAFIDSELRARVDGDIAAFLAAFDAALAEDTPASRTGLREATDRLLRAGARTRIELERLEARMPLPPRDTGRQSEPAWRQR
jgi:hypothetical protein